MAIKAEYLQQVSQLYVALFKRVPDTAGLSFWVQALADGASLDAVTQGFLRAPEAQAIYSPFATSSDFVGTFYQQVFGRVADADGLTFWADALDAMGGAASTEARAKLVKALVDTVSTPLSERPEGMSAEAYEATQTDRARFADRTEMGLYVATQTSVSVADARTIAGFLFPQLDSNPAAILQIKAGAFDQKIDAALDAGTTVTGTAYGDVFQLDAAELNGAKAGFKIDGAAGEDYLLIQGGDNDVIEVGAKNIVNVETIAADSNDEGLITIDARRFEGAKTFASYESSGNVTFTNLAAGQEAGLFGGNELATFKYADGVQSAALRLVNDTYGDVVIEGKDITSVTVRSEGLYENDVDLTLGAKVSTLRLDAKARLDIGVVGGAANGTIVVTGNEVVEIDSTGDFARVDASAHTGGIDRMRVNNVDFIGTAAADRVSVIAVKATNVLELGAGDDYIYASDSDNFTIAAGARIDGGAGRDTVNSSLLKQDTYAAFHNFEIVRWTGSDNVDTTLLTNSTIDTLVVNTWNNGGLRAPTPIEQKATIAAGTKVLFNEWLDYGSVNTVVVKGAISNVADVLNVSIADEDGDGVNAQTLKVANVETINVSSTAKANEWNYLTLDAAALRTVTLTGDAQTALSFTEATSVVGRVDASAHTGKVSLDLSNVKGANTGLAVLGGSADDYLTVTSASTLTGGAGKDTFVVGAEVASIKQADVAAALVTITDFASGDAINLKGMTIFEPFGVYAKSLFLFDGSAQATLADAAKGALQAAVIADEVSAVVAFRFGDESYLVADRNRDDAFSAGDVVVKLVGVTDFSNIGLENGVVVFDPKDIPNPP